MGGIPEGWRLAWVDLPGRTVGETCWTTRTITIDPRIPAAARRCTLTHELVHVERGPIPAPAYQAREEVAVERETARRLIGLHDLAEALAESDQPGHVAELLDVDLDTLAARLSALDPDEHAYLCERLGVVAAPISR